MFREVDKMKKTHLIGILIGLAITLSILPAVNAVGSIALSHPPERPTNEATH